MTSQLRPATRAVLASIVGLNLLGITVLVGVIRERNGLLPAARAFLAASTQATEVTTCLQGARDELFLPGQGELRTEVAVDAALTRLRECDISALHRSLGAVELPPAAPWSNADRRHARASIASGLGALRRVVLDAQGADRAMSANLQGAPNGLYIILAYRSAAAGSATAAADAQEALALLGHPQSTVG